MSELTNFYRRLEINARSAQSRKTLKSIKSRARELWNSASRVERKGSKKSYKDTLKAVKQRQKEIS